MDHIFSIILLNFISIKLLQKNMFSVFLFFHNTKILKSREFFINLSHKKGVLWAIYINLIFFVTA